MLEGQIIMQNVTASFGQLETPSKNGDPVYTTTFVDPISGLSISVLWDPTTVREFFAKASEAMGGVIPVPPPKLQLATSIPTRGR